MVETEARRRRDCTLTAEHLLQIDSAMCTCRQSYNCSLRAYESWGPTLMPQIFQEDSPKNCNTGNITIKQGMQLKTYLALSIEHILRVGSMHVYIPMTHCVFFAEDDRRCCLAGSNGSTTSSHLSKDHA
jgi:hypothetical protein